MTDYYANDYQYIDGVEAFTLTPGPPGATGTAQTSVYGKVTDQTAQQQWANAGFGNDSYPHSITVFASTLTPSTYSIKPGDKLTSSGAVVYQVQSSRFIRITNEWELGCIKQ